MTPAEAQTKLGRKRDHSRDPEILDATLDVLAETGYDGMTIDQVAARAKAGKATLYRRWPSKAELVIDAVACIKHDELRPELLPDTGTLRGDLVAMIKPRTVEENERKMQVMAGVVSMLARAPELADAVERAIVAPRVAVNKMFIRRAIARGEISPDCDVDMLALVSPSLVYYRVLIQRRPVDPEYLLAIIDGVVLPAVGLHPGADLPLSAEPRPGDATS